MLPEQPARLLRIHLAESDRFDGKPMYEAIVQRCREMHIAGATVFRGLHKHHVGRHDQPIEIAVIDTAENLARLVPALEEMIDTGLMAISDVRILRVQKQAR